MEENNQKIKLLKIIELLEQETDEDHPIKTSDFCARLVSMNITCDTRTLGKDMRFLNNQGYEIMHRMIGHEKAYYVEDRRFSVPELKILIDAVQAASFITEKKTAELTEKLAALGGSHRAEILKSNLVRFNTTKHKNEAIYYTVDCLEQALLKKKKVSFLYFKLDENKNRVYRFDGRRYVEEPVALVYLEDNYYLLRYSVKYGHCFSYRVDRMSEVAVEEAGISAEAKAFMKTNDTAEFVKETFKMYAGESRPVRLRFNEDLISTVYDKFGEDTLMQRVDDKLVEALIKVHVSEMFYGWVAQFAGWMEVVWPRSVADDFNEYIKNINRIDDIPE